MKIGDNPSEIPIGSYHGRDRLFDEWQVIAVERVDTTRSYDSWKSSRIGYQLR